MRIRYNNIVPVLLIVMIVGMSGCEAEKVKRPAPDVSDIKMEVDLIRYDQALREINPEQAQRSYYNLVTQHPSMTDLYFKQLTKLYTDDEGEFSKRLAEFTEEERMKDLGEMIAAQFPYDKKMGDELKQPMQYARHYFPSFKKPIFYTLFTEFGYQTFIFEAAQGRNAIGIGLEYFLGPDFDYKTIDPGNPVFSSYLSRSYTKAHWSKKAMEMIVIDLIGDPPGKRFIDKMIYQGKKQYILEHLMVEKPDTILWEYSQAQMDWVRANEREIWTFLVDKELMYKTNHLLIANYLEPAPTSKGMPGAAPGRTGVYIGYKIVESYMDRYPETKLKDLVQMKDSQKLLELSKYKPARK